MAEYQVTLRQYEGEKVKTVKVTAGSPSEAGDKAREAHQDDGFTFPVKIEGPGVPKEDPAPAPDTAPDTASKG